MSSIGCGKRKLWFWKELVQKLPIWHHFSLRNSTKPNFNNFMDFELIAKFTSLTAGAAVCRTSRLLGQSTYFFGQWWKKLRTFHFRENLKMTHVMVFYTVLPLLRILLVRLTSGIYGFIWSYLTCLAHGAWRILGLIPGLGGEGQGHWAYIFPPPSFFERSFFFFFSNLPHHQAGFVRLYSDALES